MNNIPNNILMREGCSHAAGRLFPLLRVCLGRCVLSFDSRACSRRAYNVRLRVSCRYAVRHDCRWRTCDVAGEEAKKKWKPLKTKKKVNFGKIGDFVELLSRIPARETTMFCGNKCAHVSSLRSSEHRRPWACGCCSLGPRPLSTPLSYWGRDA